MSSRTNNTDFYKRAAHIASSYGFLPFNDIIKNNATGKKSNVTLSAADRKLDSLDGEITTALKRCAEYNVCEQEHPLRFFSGNVFPSQGKISFGLHILGTKESIAEACILTATHELLYELGATEVPIRINTIGDRDSSQRFVRELTAFLRKNLHELPTQSREAMKKDVFTALDLLQKKEHALCKTLPKPMEYLSTDSRKHFKEVLEYAETAGIYYELDDSLIRHRDCYTQTLFEVKHTFDSGITLLARGGRYDEFSKKLQKKEIPGVGVVFMITYPQKVNMRIAHPRVQKKPKVFFIHLGFEAKLQSMSVVEKLRKSHLPFYHSLGGQQLSLQLAHAEQLSAPYIVIMGQREAMEGTVIVRNRETHMQNIVPVEALPDYLKTVAA